MYCLLNMAGTTTMFVAAVAVLLVTVRGQAPKKCCTPLQFSVQMTDLSTINSDNFTIMKMEMDLKKKKQVMMTFTIDPKTGTASMTQKMLIDYNKKMMYFVPANDTTKCYKTPYLVEAIQCVPDDAVYLGSSYLGPVAGKLAFDGWRFKIDPNMLVTMAFTTDSCVPLVEGVSFTDNMSKGQLYLFSTYEPKLTNPEWFDLPASCS